MRSVDSAVSGNIPLLMERDRRGDTVAIDIRLLRSTAHRADMATTRLPRGLSMRTQSGVKN